MSDLESLDYEFFRSLEWIRRGEGVDFQQLGLSFSVDEEVAGKVGDNDESGSTSDAMQMVHYKLTIIIYYY